MGRTSTSGTEPTTEPWASVDDVARHLGVAKDSVYRWIEHRGLPAHKIGRLWKFGMAPEVLPHIFEPFYRAPGSKASGYGIGLATVHRIVRAAGGEVRLVSTHGEGAAFTVRLPHASATGSSTSRES